MNKFNLKSFSKQPIVQLSDGISVNLFLSSKENKENDNENQIFDAEKFGKDFLNERKKLANEEIEKLAKEIKELDDELDEDEVEKKVVLEKKKEEKEGRGEEKGETEIVENKILTSESTKLVEKSENEIIVKKRKELQKENNKNIEEREAIINFLLFSVLNQEISIQMKIKNGNGNQKDDFVTISVRQEENENENDSEENIEEEEKDKKQVESLVKYDNGIEQKEMKKTDKDNNKDNNKDTKDDFMTLVFQATDRLEPITTQNNEIERNSDENVKDSNEIMNNNNNNNNNKNSKNNSKNNYFVLAEKVLGSSLVTAFEVSNIT